MGWHTHRFGGRHVTLAKAEYDRETQVMRLHPKDGGQAITLFAVQQITYDTLIDRSQNRMDEAERAVRSGE